MSLCVRLSAVLLSNHVLLAAIPTGTQAWIWDLGYTISGVPWQVYTYNQQTAGYLTQWKNTKLAFLTIHGAGHEVPTYKPDVALDMWSKYLSGTFTSA